MAALHQFVAGFTHGDAISEEARVLRQIFRRWGFDSDIFSEVQRVLPELRAEVRDVREARVGSADAVLLHLSIGSAVNEVFASLPCRKAILYHNFTPPEYFEPVNPHIARMLRQTVTQIRSLAGVASVVLADSRFNAVQLEAYGYRGVSVFPVILDFTRFEDDSGTLPRNLRGDGRLRILFVGRGAPNKRLEDLLLAFAYYRRYVDPNSQLVHVGSFAGTERYRALLAAMQKELGLDPYAVIFTGSLPQPSLNAVYRSSHLFLCMSEHEGFCIPLLESMYYGIPVMAHAAGAIPETLGGAGVLFYQKDFPAIAELMGRLNRDLELRSAVLRAQHERLLRYRARRLEDELAGHLRPILPELRRGTA